MDQYITLDVSTLENDLGGGSPEYCENYGCGKDIRDILEVRSAKILGSSTSPY